MRKRKRPHGKRRRFKRVSDRRLSSGELHILDFLWTWKVASTPMLGLVGFKGKSHWWVYKGETHFSQEFDLNENKE